MKGDEARDDNVGRNGQQYEGAYVPVAVFALKAILVRDKKVEDCIRCGAI